ncbi:MAG: metal-dependent hydrolase [Sphingomonadales bacterium]
MDNLAHTLAGAALGEAGLKRKTGLGMATLMIAANLPDLDVIGLFFGENLAWRRGWTHGPVALVLLPPLLAWIMLAFDRWQARRGRRPADRLPVRFGWILVLAYIGILSHPLLDFLNTYGIRCLMPFSDRWFYGDALFIIDLLVWTSLGTGVWLSRRRAKLGWDGARRPAVAALAFVAAYSIAMGAGSAAAERYVARQVAAARGEEPKMVLASPVPLDPFRRSIVFSTGPAYGFGELRWRPGMELALDPDLVPTNMDDPAIAAAQAQDRKVADFLYWSRLPFAEVERRPGVAEVIIGDARYQRWPSDGRFTVRATVPE